MSALLSEKIENPVHMFDKKVIAAAGDGCVQAKGKNCGLGIATTFSFFWIRDTNYEYVCVGIYHAADL
jgi:hypothetical protein